VPRKNSGDLRRGNLQGMDTKKRRCSITVNWKKRVIENKNLAILFNKTLKKNAKKKSSGCCSFLFKTQLNHLCINADKSMI
jgi:hypothetical protein